MNLDKALLLKEILLAPNTPDALARYNSILDTESRDAFQDDNTYSILIIAIEQYLLHGLPLSLEFVQSLLTRIEDLNKVRIDKKPLLHFTITTLYANAKMPRIGHLYYLFFKQGLDFNSVSDNRQTAAHLAALRQNKELLKCLFDLGAGMNIPDSELQVIYDIFRFEDNESAQSFVRTIGLLANKTATIIRQLSPEPATPAPAAPAAALYQYAWNIFAAPVPWQGNRSADRADMADSSLRASFASISEFNDPYEKNVNGDRPVHLAALTEDTDALVYCFARGANLTLPNNAGETVLSILLNKNSQLLRDPEVRNIIQSQFPSSAIKLLLQRLESAEPYKYDPAKIAAIHSAEEKVREDAALNARKQEISAAFFLPCRLNNRDTFNKKTGGFTVNDWDIAISLAIQKAEDGNIPVLMTFLSYCPEAVKTRAYADAGISSRLSKFTSSN